MDDLLRPKEPPPAPKAKPGTLGSGGEPECGFCGSALDDEGFCPTCDAGDDPFEIEL